MSERIQRILREQDRIKQDIEDAKKVIESPSKPSATMNFNYKGYADPPDVKFKSLNKWEIACKILGYEYVYKESKEYKEVMKVFKQL